jgi:Flp pilus assembly protein TadB
MSTRDPAPLRRLDRAGHRRRGRHPRPLAARVGVAAGVLLGAIVATSISGLLPRAAAVSGLLPVVLVAAVAWPVMGWVAGRRAAARRLAIRRDAAPAVLDLLGAALLAGLNPHKAVLRVAERAPEVLHQDLGMAAAVLRLGGTPAAALRAAADRSGLDELRAAAAALEAAERWGAPPAEALAARAEALRSRARLQAEAEAGRAAVRLAFPLVLCFLPAFVLTNVKLWLQQALRRIRLGRLRGGGQQRAIAEHRDRDGIAEDHTLGLDQWPQRLLVLLEGVAALMGLHGRLVHPGLVQPELIRVVGRAMHPKGEIAPLALFDPTRVG